MIQMNVILHKKLINLLNKNLVIKLIININLMARNTKNGGRLGPVNNRTQIYNSRTKKYIKRDEHGKFLACKDTPFKGIRREESAKKQERQKAN